MSLYQEILPAVDDSGALDGRHKNLSSGGQEPVRLGRATLGQLAIESRGEQPCKKADPPPMASSDQLRRAVGVDEKKRRSRSAWPFGRDAR
jgi:hypothetical protein